jgi:hypothetical protein
VAAAELVRAERAKQEALTSIHNIAGSTLIRRVRIDRKAQSRTDQFGAREQDIVQGDRFLHILPPIQTEDGADGDVRAENNLSICRRHKANTKEQRGRLLTRY